MACIYTSLLHEKKKISHGENMQPPPLLISNAMGESDLETDNAEL